MATASKQRRCAAEHIQEAIRASTPRFLSLLRGDDARLVVRMSADILTFGMACVIALAFGLPFLWVR